MKAWQLDRLGGSLSFNDVALPAARPGTVLVRMETSVLMSYMAHYVDGKLSGYRAPDGPFIPGGNGVGRIHAVGRDVWHLQPGQRVLLSPHLVAHENVRRPAQMLIGVTAAGADGARMQADWPDGTLAEYALLPASALTPVDNMQQFDPITLAMLMRYIVPYGGLLRGRLAAGETVVVSGATGAYGRAAVLLALAMGAARVVAIGRRADALAPLARHGQGRVVPLVLTGDGARDADHLRAATNGGAELAFDMVGAASDPGMTLAALRSLLPGGRLVLMGSMSVPLPIPYLEVMLNSWEILGQFMYPAGAHLRLVELLRSGQLDMTVLTPLTYALAALPRAIERAATAANFECVVIEHEE